ncbi:hypothetical protein IJ750_03690 [bacterium]|nr:hypothetical protein [bacterium]
MRINSVINFNQPKYNPCFNSYSEKKLADDYSFYTTTTFFRNDLDWDSFVRYIDEMYKADDKVNIVCHACSNGEEAYSLAAKLITVLGEKAKKFFPIIAKDLDYENIDLAKRGLFQVTDDELRTMRWQTGYNLERYFDVLSKKGEKLIDIAVRPELKDKVIFSQGNILEDVEKLPNENTILLCRNFWPYLPKESVLELAQKLGKILTKSCSIVLGNFDMFNGWPNKHLYENGFFDSEIYGMFTKDSSGRKKSEDLVQYFYESLKYRKF